MSSRKAAFLETHLLSCVPIDWPEPFGLVMIEAMSAARRLSPGVTVRLPR